MIIYRTFDYQMIISKIRFYYIPIYEFIGNIKSIIDNLL